LTGFLRTAPFLGAKPAGPTVRIALFGCPYDGTASFRPGARFGPQAIREASQVLETYDPKLECDLADCSFSDAGDVEVSPGNKSDTLARIGAAARSVLAARQIPAVLGGEHLITLPVVQAVHEVYPDLVIVQFDAHFDLKDSYLGDRLSHATVMRRIAEVITPSRILQLGARSGVLEEFQFARNCRVLGADASPPEIRQWVADRPVYVTVDLDILDPAYFPAAGTPEPGGLSFCQLEDWLLALRGVKLVGWDVVELAPHWDPTQVSSVVGAKIVRTLLGLTAVC